MENPDASCFIIKGCKRDLTKVHTVSAFLLNSTNNFQNVVETRMVRTAVGHVDIVSEEHSVTT